jgi:dsDNA-specific endonuclease/ATPase MutS2
MYKRFDPFVDTLPQLDVHGLTRDLLMVEVNGFIYENFRMGREKVAVIHGHGSKILMHELHDKLKKNKYVNKFYTYHMNDGCTIIELKKENK